MKKVYSISIVMLLMTSMISCDRKPNQKIYNNNETNILEHNTIKKKKSIELVSEYIKEEKIKQAVDLLQKLDEEENYLAKYNLAKLYIREEYSRKKEIERLLKECLETNHKVNAAHLLGYLFYEGICGFNIDYSEAYKYFKISKGNGHEHKLDRVLHPFVHKTKTGYYYLGMLYYNGKGVRESKSKAHNYFLEANLRIDSSPESNFMLGKMRFFGEGTKVNKVDGVSSIRLAYDKDYPEAIKFWDEYKLWKY